MSHQGGYFNILELGRILRSMQTNFLSNRARSMRCRGTKRHRMSLKTAFRSHSLEYDNLCHGSTALSINRCRLLPNESILTYRAVRLNL
jgi:hypothetical protein